MFEKIQKLLDRIQSRIALWQFVQGLIVLCSAGISGRLSTGVDWINQFGLFGWWCAAIAGALCSLAVLLAFAWLRLVWRRGIAIAKWSSAVDTINPLNDEFSRIRINISDLRDPATNRVARKTFIGCDLIGPANIAFINDCQISYVGFVNCDVIPIKSNVNIINAIGFEHVLINKGRIIGATLLIPESLVGTFKDMGAQFLSYVPTDFSASPVKS